MRRLVSYLSLVLPPPPSPLPLPCRLAPSCCNDLAEHLRLVPRSRCTSIAVPTWAMKPCPTSARLRSPLLSLLSILLSLLSILLSHDLNEPIEQALEMLLMCLTCPATALSAIQVEAYKKYSATPALVSGVVSVDLFCCCSTRSRLHL